MRRLVVLLAAAFALAAPASAQAVVVGIADQKPDMFGDVRFQQLGIKHARLAVPWDWRKYDWQIQELNQWLFLAKIDGVYPLISFQHSRVNRRQLPTPVKFQREFKAFRARYPWVTNFATWNEANHCGEPVCHRPKLVASYWRKLQQACRTCKVLAAEVLDLPSMAKWVKDFRRYAKREPANWGLHNYVEANRFTTKSLRRLLKQVKGKIWLTEVGGLVRRRGTPQVQKNRVKGIPESTKHAARVTRYLFRKVLPLNKRISRVYLYHWNSSTRYDSWDSGFIGWDRKTRPAYKVLVRQLKQLRTQEARAKAKRRR